MKKNNWWDRLRCALQYHAWPRVEVAGNRSSELFLFSEPNIQIQCERCGDPCLFKGEAVILNGRHRIVYNEKGVSQKS